MDTNVTDILASCAGRTLFGSAGRSIVAIGVVSCLAVGGFTATGAGAALSAQPQNTISIDRTGKGDRLPWCLSGLQLPRRHTCQPCNGRRSGVILRLVAPPNLSVRISLAAVSHEFADLMVGELSRQPSNRISTSGGVGPCTRKPPTV